MELIMITLKLVLYPIKKYTIILMKIAEAKKAVEPSSDFPFASGVPTLVPINAARQSDIININHEEMARPFENNKAVRKNPTIIKVLPLNPNVPLCSLGRIRLAKNLSVNFLIRKS